MILSQTAQYAVRAIIYLSEHESEAPLRVDDIAGGLDVPRNYLSKILHVLARAGLLTSTRGPRGGFELARAAESLPLAEVVEHFDHTPDERQCLLGRESCSDRKPCHAHGRWKEVAVAVRSFLDETSIAELIEDHGPAPAGQEAGP